MGLRQDVGATGMRHGGGGGRGGVVGQGVGQLTKKERRSEEPASSALFRLESPSPSVLGDTSSPSYS